MYAIPKLLPGIIWLSSALAQTGYPHHNFTFAVGAGRPRGDLHGPFIDAPGLTIGYGYRFHPYFQADVGLDVLFGSANVRDFIVTGLGDLTIRDREFFIPFGGRAIIPLINGRLLVSAGGGGAHLRYTELLRQPSNFFRLDCRVCTSRVGWAYYALADISSFIDHYRHFRVGVTSKFYRGHTDGDPLGDIPGVRTKDHWINLFGEIGFSF